MSEAPVISPLLRIEVGDGGYADVATASKGLYWQFWVISGYFTCYLGYSLGLFCPQRVFLSRFAYAESTMGKRGVTVGVHPTHHKQLLFDGARLPSHFKSNASQMILGFLHLFLGVQNFQFMKYAPRLKD